MCVSSGEHSEDVRLMRGPVTKLIELVKQFGREYSAEKDKMNSADFSDILHRALNLLAVSDGRGGYIKPTLHASCRRIMLKYSSTSIRI